MIRHTHIATMIQIASTTCISLNSNYVREAEGTAVTRITVPVKHARAVG